MKLKIFQLRIIIGMIVGIIFLACSDRERSNPLDPRNPNTQGRPTGLTAYAMERKVYLRWDAIAFKDLQAINIYRKTNDDSIFTRIGQTLTSSYVDDAVQYGIRYEYYVTAQVDGYESAPSNTVHCTPGPTFTWVSDYQAGSVVCLTHDLQTEIMRFGALYYPQVIDVSSKERSVWVAVRYEKQVLKINRFGEITAARPNMESVVDICVDTTMLDVWIAQKNPGRLTRLDSYGALGATTPLLEEPRAIVSPNNSGICWVLDGGDGTLKAFDLAGRRLTVTERLFTRPMDLVYVPHTRTFWVADSSAIIQCDHRGAPTGLKVEPFYYVSLLAYDHQNRCLWAIDWERWGEPSKLIKIDQNGRILWSLSAFSYPLCVAANEYDGSCFVGDAGYDHYGLFRVSPDGQEITMIGRFYLPVSIAVEYH